MATVSGQVIFDRDRSSSISTGDSGIANVPVVLQNISTGVRLVVLTDASGNYTFINVPIGSYRIVEAFGTTGGVPTPGDFSTAVLGPVPTATTPPISFVSNPPIGSTNLDSTIPNTILITVTNADVTNQNILNGAVIYTPIQNILDPCVSVSNTNLITDADNGTFGFFTPGTPANTGPATEPYPGVTPDFTYVIPDPTQYTPIDGEYTVQNIMNNSMSNQIGAWWRIADHTTGNETGRMMIVNGFNPGAVFFRSTVPVTPNTNYLFSTWILNLFKVTGYPPAELGVRILDQNGNILYQDTLGELIPVNTNAPEWREIGTVLNSQNNTQLTVEFFSEGEAVIGNDYAIDDVSLREVTLPIFIPIKTISTPIANVGDTVTYTVQLTNTCLSPLTNVVFTDIIPNGLVFIPDSVTVNNAPLPGADPNIGFPLPDILGGTTTEITFEARVESIPDPNPIDNIATINYSYTPVEGGIPNDFSVDSNPVPLEVITADLAVIKTAEPVPVNPGQELIYTIDVINNGPFPAENVTLTDTLPETILNPEYSVDGGISFEPWTESLNLGTLTVGEVRAIIIRGIVDSSATEILINTAVVSSTTEDPNLDNNTSTTETDVNPSADLLVIKTADSNSAVPGTLLQYEIKVNNLGPSNAENVVLSDTIPDTLIDPEYSIDGGTTFEPWTGSLDLGTLAVDNAITVLIRGTVSLEATDNIINTATVTSPTPDPDLGNNDSTITTPVNPQAGISITKVANSEVAVPGEELVYNIEIFNEGPSNATSVILTDPIPSEILNPEYSIDGGITFEPWTGTLNIGTVAPNQLVRVIIRGIIRSTAIGVITNTATVDALVPDPVTDDSTVITPVIPSADIGVIKISNLETAIPGEVISYTITVTNAGPSAAQNVTLVDNLPISILNPEFSVDGGTTFSPWTGGLSLGSVDANEVRVIIIRGIVSPSATGVLTNTSTVNSTTPDPNPDNNTSTTETPVNPSADISIIKQNNEPMAIPGDPFSYTITVRNLGPSSAQDVVLTDNIPDAILNPEYSIDGGITFEPWTGRLNLGTLEMGEGQIIILRGTVRQTATGTIVNTAIVSSATDDPNPDNNTSTTETEISPSADILVIKTAVPNPAVPGSPLLYQIEGRNLGPSSAENVVLNDEIPDTILNPQFSTDGGATFQPWTGSVNLGTLAVGDSVTVLIEGTIDLEVTGAIINVATVASSTPDPDLSNNTSTTITPVNPSADLAVTKTSNLETAIPGEEISYTITVTNAGPSASQSVTLIDNIPTAILNPEYSIDGGINFEPWTGRLDLGTVEPGEVIPLIIRGIVSPTATGVLTNTAIVSSPTPDPDPDNNTSTVETPINPVVVESDLSVIKQSNTPTALPGEFFSYTITVTNLGPDAAQNVVLTDFIPSSLLNPQFSLNGAAFEPWTGRLDLGTVEPGEVITLIIRGIVSPTATGILTNTAIVSSSTPDPNPNNNASTTETPVGPVIPPSADVSVVKLVNKRKACVGDRVTFKIIVSNEGPANAQNVTVIDNVSSFLKLAVFSIDDRKTYNLWTGRLVLGTLPAGTSRVIFISGIIMKTCACKIINMVDVTSTTLDLNLNNNTAAVIVEIKQPCCGDDHCCDDDCCHPNCCHDDCHKHKPCSDDDHRDECWHKR